MNRFNVRVIFDVSYSNPNGDPDNNNQPRINAYDDTGFTTDACLKRLIRDTMHKIGDSEGTLGDGNNNYYTQDAVLEEQHITCLKELKIKPDGKTNKSDKPDIRDWYLKNFIDIRLFGAVLAQSMASTRGPVTVTFAKSFHPIAPIEVGITRCCIETKKAEKTKGTNTTMGKKWVVPYALYYFDIYINGHDCEKMGVTKEEIEFLFRSVQSMFSLNRTSSKSDINFVNMFIFEHDSPLGLRQDKEDFACIKVDKKFTEDEFPSSIEDFDITLNKDNIPDGITVKVL